MTRIKYFYSLLFIVCFCLTTNAQKKNLVASTTFHYGFVIPHHPYLAHLTQGHTNGYEINVGYRTNGTKNWHQEYLQPYFGLGYLFFDLKNPQYLGTGHSLYPYIYLPVTRNKNFRWSFKLAYGIGYLTKHFDIEENYKNLAIGSGVNAFIHINNFIDFKISDRLRGNTGFSFSHYSNGAFKVPNLGINIPSLNLGVVYRINEHTIQVSDSIYRYSYDRKFQHKLLLAGAIKEISPVQGPKYAVGTIGYSLYKKVSFKSALNTGLDIIYDSSIPVKFDRDSISYSSDFEATRVGVNFGYNLEVGNLTLLFQPGVYLVSKYKDQGIIYGRYGFAYHINKTIGIGLNVKTHFFVADYFEVATFIKLK